MKKKNLTISIIGAGASGTILLNQLVEKCSTITGLSVRIRLIEKSGEFGPGLAYSTPVEAHIINMRADTMGAVTGRDDHFSLWMEERFADLQRAYPDFSGDLKAYPPRRVYGDYLEDLMKGALEKAEHGDIQVECIHAEAADLVRRGSGLELLLKDGDRFASDVIILALGNFPSNLFRELRGVEGFFPSPWPASSILEKVSPDKPAGILGAGLSAIDTLFTLLAKGHREKITFLSRRGFLPKVQGPPSEHDLTCLRLENIKDHMSRQGGRRLPLTDMVHRFYKEIERAEGGSIDWFQVFNPEGSAGRILEADIERARKGPLPYQAALLATEPIIGQLWNMLSAEDRIRFDREYKSLWTVYRHPMPLVNAEKILEVLKTGQLEILSGCLCIRSCGPGEDFEIDMETRFGVPYTFKTPYLINAAGQGLDVKHFESALIQNLLTGGFIQPHPSGGIQVAFDTSQVLDREGTLLPGVYAVGEITRGVHFYTNGIHPNMLAGDRITDHVLKQFI